MVLVGWAWLGSWGVNEGGGWQCPEKSDRVLSNAFLFGKVDYVKVCGRLAMRWCGDVFLL